jgi:hypothetical protein
MRKAPVIMFGLFLSFILHAPKQEDTPARAERVHRFEYAAGSDSVMEASIDLANRIKEPGDMVVVRLCSKDPLPLALFTNAISPTLVIGKNLSSTPNLTPQNILYLRSEDCISSYPLASAGELWVIPKGVNPPSSVESVKYCQLQIKNVASESTIKNNQSYRVELKKISTRLRDNPSLIAIVIGNYYKNPSSSLKQNLYKAQKIFEQNGTPQRQYFVRLQLWTGSYSGNPSEPELKYPNIFITEILKDCE